MAKLKTGNGSGKYKDPYAKFDVINYILDSEKTPHNYYGYFNTGNGLVMNENLSQHVSEIVQSMDETSIQYNKANGVQLRHFFIGFAPEELRDYRIANEIGAAIGASLAQEYQTVYAVHEDTEHINIHFVMNSVSQVTGKRYGGHKDEFYRMMNMMRFVLRRYHIYKLEYVSKDAEQAYI